MSSGPERKEHLTFEQIKINIEETCAYSSLSLVIFAGGEPTLLKSDLIKSIAFCKTRGLRTRVVTNASWATDDKRTVKMIDRFVSSGLDELNISSDDYHLPFIPFENVKRAWYASKNVGFQSLVIANCFHESSVITPEFIMQELGEEIALCYDENGKMRPISPSPDGRTTCLISNAFVQNIGRGSGKKISIDLPQSSRADLSGFCPWAVTSAAISADNHLVACCGIEASGNHVLDYGLIDSRRGVTENLEKASGDVLTNAIATFGPLFLLDMAKSYRPDLKFRENLNSVCEVCEVLTTNISAVNVLREHQMEIAALLFTTARRSLSDKLSEMKG